MSSDFIVYDCETKKHFHQVKGGWDNIYDHGMSSCVTFNSKSSHYRFFIDREEVCKYLHGKLVVTFNGIMFDSLLLLGNDRILEKNGITRNDKYWWVNADLYVEMWRRILDLDKDYPKIIEEIKKQKFSKGIFSLNDIAGATLGHTKTENGSHAPDLYQQNRIIELLEYNINDTAVIRDLYLFVKQNKFMITGNYDVISFR